MFVVPDATESSGAVGAILPVTQYRELNHCPLIQQWPVYTCFDQERWVAATASQLHTSSMGSALQNVAVSPLVFHVVSVRQEPSHPRSFSRFLPESIPAVNKKAGTRRTDGMIER